MKFADVKQLAEEAGFFFNKYDMIVADEDREIDPHLLAKFTALVLCECAAILAKRLECEDAPDVRDALTECWDEIIALKNNA